jgi:hypothetical protein
MPASNEYHIFDVAFDSVNGMRKRCRYAVKLRSRVGQSHGTLSLHVASWLPGITM